MTYDVAVWKHVGPLSHDAATEEFDRRCEQADARFDEGPAVVEFLGRTAPSLGLIVYDPQTESVVT